MEYFNLYDRHGNLIDEKQFREGNIEGFKKVLECII